MIQVRVHGRGGQGAVTFAHVLCASATYEGKYGQSCMAPTVERRGAPVEAYGRIGDKPIAERGVVLAPDFVVVLNPVLVTAVNVEGGLGDNGKLIINSTKEMELGHEATFVDATAIAIDLLGIPITNTVMLGALAGATGIISVDALEKGIRLMLARLSEDKLNNNIKAMKAGYEEVKRG